MYLFFNRSGIWSSLYPHGVYYISAEARYFTGMLAVQCIYPLFWKHVLCTLTIVSKHSLCGRNFLEVPCGKCKTKKWKTVKMWHHIKLFVQCLYPVFQVFCVPKVARCVNIEMPLDWCFLSGERTLLRIAPTNGVPISYQVVVYNFSLLLCK